MQFGFIIPGGDIPAVLELAVAAEEAGWDGVFIPDCISIQTATIPARPAFDPWVMLGAMAARTRRVKLGTIITPVSRRRPWKLASEAVTVDHLSGGRLILAVGLGAAEEDAGFAKVGEAMTLKTRAERLDEGLAIIDGLWRGTPFTFHGQHFQVEDMTMLPPPVQQPRIPIWVVGSWPRQRSIQRVLAWDGIIPQKFDPVNKFAEMTPDDIRALREDIAARRTATTPYAIVVEGHTPGDDPARARAQVQPLAEAGATWWNEAMWDEPVDLARVLTRIRQGPPRL
jgi:alkanesulfonate monooxygenase SsuD/methylene tetrahydromethanopterin reductase-like flavin-dependent oxidoreductase (luciferase family)